MDDENPRDIDETIHSRPSQSDDPTSQVEPPDEKRWQQEFDAARVHLLEIQAQEDSDEKADELHDAYFAAEVAWLRLKWGERGRAPGCPYCAAKQWAVDQPISLLFKGGGHLRPLFPVICTNCGQTTFVSTVYANLNFEEGEGKPEDGTK